MKINFYLSLLLCIATKAYTQDFVFANTRQSLVHLTPSFAGSNGGFRFQSSYKTQKTVNESFAGSVNSADFYLKKLKAGMAVSYIFGNFDQGVMRNDAISYSYAQYLSIADNQLKIIPSLQFAVMKTQLDRTKLPLHDYGHYCFPTAIDEPIAQQQKYNYDFSSGLMMNYKGFYFGGSVFHINKPNVGLSGDVFLPRRFNAYLSSNLALNKWMHVNINLRYEQQGSYKCGYLQANTLIAKHILFNAGLNTWGYNNVGLGYLGDFFVASLDYEVTSFGWERSIQAQVSINIRDKEHQKAFVTFESQ